MSGTLIKAPATCHKCSIRFISPTTGLVDSECYKCGGRIFTDGATGDTETLDLMRDEFHRIKNLTDNSEIKGLCDRAVSGIQQHLPVLGQRDKYQAEASKIKAENSVLREALEKVRGYGTADLGHQQMCDYVTEVATEALEWNKPK
jgi:hypothetical protein